MLFRRLSVMYMFMLLKQNTVSLWTLEYMDVKNKYWDISEVLEKALQILKAYCNPFPSWPYRLFSLVCRRYQKSSKGSD